MTHVRTAHVARIGRSYPRPLRELARAERSVIRRIPAHLRVFGALLAVLSAFGLVGWLFSRVISR